MHCISAGGWRQRHSPGCQACRQVCSPLGLTYNGVPRPSTIHTRNLIQLSKVNGLCATYVTVNVAIVCNWSLPADYLPCCTNNARILEYPNSRILTRILEYPHAPLAILCASLAESNCKLNATSGLFSAAGRRASWARLEASSIVFGFSPTPRLR